MKATLYIVTDSGIEASKNGTMTYEEATKKIETKMQNGEKDTYFQPALTALDKMAIKEGFKSIDDAILWANNNDKNNIARREIAVKLRERATLLWNKINNVEIDPLNPVPVDDVLDDDDTDVAKSPATVSNSAAKVSGSIGYDALQVFNRRH